MNQRTPTTPNVKRNPTLSIAKHTRDTRHKVDAETSFKILLHDHNLIVLQFCEAFVIETHNPELCIQKLLMQSIRLPWS